MQINTQYNSGVRGLVKTPADQLQQQKTTVCFCPLKSTIRKHGGDWLNKHIIGSEKSHKNMSSVSGWVRMT